ncbi:hypothetical protein R1flu_004220 [Riccia fluitans]|uniref:Uncharacterized protein n=1 Tax=Riccia fluitans TaxID=41844 RepID=A0ABD1YPN8_9MARC
MHRMSELHPLHSNHLSPNFQLLLVLRTVIEEFHGRPSAPKLVLWKENSGRRVKKVLQQQDLCNHLFVCYFLLSRSCGFQSNMDGDQGVVIVFDPETIPPWLPTD